MFAVSATALILVTALGSTHASKLPPDFKRCVRSDPQVEDCMREAIQTALRLMTNGIQSLKVLPTDPLAISKIYIEDSPDRPVSLKLYVTDAKLNGLKDVQIVTAKSDLNQRHVIVDVLVPTMNLTGNYEMDGKFLILPLKGKGKLYSQIDQVTVKADLKAEPKTKNGDVYWDVKDFKLVVGDIAKFTNQFDNLFNGDETLGKPTNEALNTNWREFWEALRPALEETFSVILRNIAENVLSKVPEKHMFL